MKTPERSVEEIVAPADYTENEAKCFWRGVETALETLQAERQRCEEVVEAVGEAIELLTSAHVSTDLVWKRHDVVEKLKALTQPNNNK